MSQGKDIIITIVIVITVVVNSMLIPCGALSERSTNIVDHKCRSHPDWSAIFHPYVNLPEVSYLLRIAEWNAFCNSSAYANITSQTPPGILAAAWSDFTSFMPLTSCVGQFKTRHNDTLPTTTTTTTLRLCIDLTQLGVTAGAILWFILQYYYPEKYGAWRLSSSSSSSRSSSTRPSREMYSCHLRDTSYNLNCGTVLQRYVRVYVSVCV